MSPVDPALPMRHTAAYRVRFDEATPRGLLRGSALLGYVQDVAWRHSEALGFPRDWYREKGVAWLVRAVEARVLAPIADGETVAVTTRLTGYRKVMARRETEVAGPAGELRARRPDRLGDDGRPRPGPHPGRVRARADRRAGAVHPRPGGPAAEPARRDGPALLAAPARARPDEPRQQRRLPRLARRGGGGGGRRRGRGDRGPARAPTAWSTCARPSPAPRSSRPPGATAPAGPTAWRATTAPTSSGVGSTRPERRRGPAGGTTRPARGYPSPNAKDARNRSRHPGGVRNPRASTPSCRRRPAIPGDLDDRLQTDRQRGAGQAGARHAQHHRRRDDQGRHHEPQRPAGHLQPRGPQRPRDGPPDQGAPRRDGHRDHHGPAQGGQHPARVRSGAGRTGSSC